MMPTVFLVEGYRFFFYSNENDEPMHVHVQKGDANAKIWLQPLRIAYAHGLKPGEIKSILGIISSNSVTLVIRWNAHFRK